MGRFYANGAIGLRAVARMRDEFAVGHCAVLTEGREGPQTALTAADASKTIGGNSIAALNESAH